MPDYQAKVEYSQSLSFQSPDVGNVAIPEALVICLPEEAEEGFNNMPPRVLIRGQLAQEFNAWRAAAIKMGAAKEIVSSQMQTSIQDAGATVAASALAEFVDPAIKLDPPNEQSYYDRASRSDLFRKITQHYHCAPLDRLNVLLYIPGKDLPEPRPNLNRPYHTTHKNRGFFDEYGYNIMPVENEVTILGSVAALEYVLANPAEQRGSIMILGYAADRMNLYEVLHTGPNPAEKKVRPTLSLYDKAYKAFAPGCHMELLADDAVAFVKDGTSRNHSGCNWGSNGHVIPQWK